jgi:hypothetical protein
MDQDSRTAAEAPEGWMLTMLSDCIQRAMRGDDASTDVAESYSATMKELLNA